jgi:hypothetical protein
MKSQKHTAALRVDNDSAGREMIRQALPARTVRVLREMGQVVVAKLPLPLVAWRVCPQYSERVAVVGKRALTPSART